MVKTSYVYLFALGEEYVLADVQTCWRKTMNLMELQQYISLMQAHRNFIFILPRSDMLTKKGDVRKNWLHKFFEQNSEVQLAISPPKSGTALEEGIAIKVPNYGSFYLMSYKKEHIDMGDYIKALALYKKIIYAEITDVKLTLSNNSEFDLENCEIDAYNPIPII